MPSVCAVWDSPSAPSFGASDANAVLHDLAKSVCSGTLPNSKSCAFLNVRPLTVNVFGHATTVLVLPEPFDSTPSAVTVLNVEPGGVCAVSARSRSPPLGPLATATMAPSLIRIATRADRWVWPTSAVSAAFWIFTSSVVLIDFPDCGSEWNSTRSAPEPWLALGLGLGLAPEPAPDTVTDTPGAPRSTSS